MFSLASTSSSKTPPGSPRQAQIPPFMTTLAPRAVSLQGAAVDLPLPWPSPAHPHPAWPSASGHCHCGHLSLLCLSSLQTLEGRTHTHARLDLCGTQPCPSHSRGPHTVSRPHWYSGRLHYRIYFPASGPVCAVLTRGMGRGRGEAAFVFLKARLPGSKWLDGRTSDGY